MKKTLYLALGWVGVVLGALGAVLPFLPTVPFLLLAACGFAKSNKRLHQWLIHTKLYKNNLESYVQGQGMTRTAKIRVMLTVTLLMSVGFLLMHRVALGRWVLCAVWLFHVLYFLFVVKTRREAVQ